MESPSVFVFDSDATGSAMRLKKDFSTASCFAKAMQDFGRNDIFFAGGNKCVDSCFGSTTLATGRRNDTVEAEMAKR